LEVLIWAAFGVSLLVFILFYFRQPMTDKTNPDEFSYQRQRALFAEEEKTFFIALDGVVDGRAVILAKVRVADVLAPAKEKSIAEKRNLYNQIADMHFDFVLCHPGDLSVICVIVLGSGSQGENKRDQRDVFLAKTCIAANLPLVQFARSLAYDADDIEKRVGRFLPIKSQQVVGQEEPVYMWTKLGLQATAKK